MTEDCLTETDRLILRLVKETDLEDLLLLFQDTVAMRYFPSTRDRNGTKQWIDQTLERYERDGYGFYAVVRKEPMTLVGYCGLLLQEDVGGKDEVEIGYGLIRAFWHQGFAVEAAAASKEYGFRARGFRRLISLIRPENGPSIRVAERNGMAWEKDVVRWGYTYGVYVVENREP